MSTTGAQPDWGGLLKWSLAHSDGTKPTEKSKLSPEDVAWLEQVSECADSPALYPFSSSVSSR